MTSPARPQIGFIGLGKMGVPICHHIRAAGYPLTAFVRHTTAREKAKSIDVATSDRLSAIADLSDIVISAITDDDALRAITMGSDGLAGHMRKGCLYIDTSTVSPQASAEVASL